MLGEGSACLYWSSRLYLHVGHSPGAALSVHPDLFPLTSFFLVPPESVV